MRRSLTAVLERNTILDGDFETEPYEVGWAGEARWFVQVLDVAGEGVAVRMVTQISPDGVTWCDYDGVEHVVAQVGVISWPVREFGHWLRLRGRVQGGNASAKVRIYLAGKS